MTGRIRPWRQWANPQGCVPPPSVDGQQVADIRWRSNSTLGGSR